MNNDTELTYSAEIDVTKSGTETAYKVKNGENNFAKWIDIAKIGSIKYVWSGLAKIKGRWLRGNFPWSKVYKGFFVYFY